MKKLLLLAIIAGAIISCAGKQSNNTQEAAPAYVDSLALNHPEYLPGIPLDTIAPEVSAPDTLGNTLNLSQYKGSYVVVDFWATWCGDCRKETPELKKLYAELGGKMADGTPVEFLGYSFDRDSTAWKDYLKKEEMPWPQISTLQPRWKEIEITRLYQINWIPAFIVISPEGTVLAKAITANGLRQELKNIAEKDK